MNLNLTKISLVLIALILSGCNTWSTSQVELNTAAPGQAAATSESAANQPAKLAKDIIVTEKDFTDRKYKTLGDIEVTVSKTTIFHDDPTRELVDEKLQEEAAKINADAVILVRYGTVGVSLMSWGSLDGRGRAIAFDK